MECSPKLIDPRLGADGSVALAVSVAALVGSPFARRTSGRRSFVDGGGAGAPCSGFDVADEREVPLVQRYVAAFAEEHEVVDVRFAFSGCFPGKDVMGDAAVVVGAALDASAISDDQRPDLGGGGVSMSSTFP